MDIIHPINENLCYFSIDDIASTWLYYNPDDILTVFKESLKKPNYTENDIYGISWMVFMLRNKKYFNPIISSVLNACNTNPNIKSLFTEKFIIESLFDNPLRKKRKNIEYTYENYMYNIDMVEVILDMMDNKIITIDLYLYFKTLLCYMYNTVTNVKYLELNIKCQNLIKRIEYSHDIL